jgi:Transposase DDE domain
MASDSRELLSAQGLQGVKFLRRLEPLLSRLRPAACQRDRAGNRELFYDQLCSLILLTFFNPTVKTLRDLSQASRLTQVKRKLGCREAALGSLSEALHVFDASLLVPLIEDLLGQINDQEGRDPRLTALADIPTAVDGTLLKQLPQITQACFGTRRDRGWKLHTHFEVLRGVPTWARVSDGTNRGAASEQAMLRAMLLPGRCYLTDRGYESFVLFNAIVAAGSSYVCRVRNDHHFTRESQGEPGFPSQEAGVLEDAMGRMGSPKSLRIEHPDHRQRRIVLRCPSHPKRRGRRRQAATHEIVLVTNLLDVPAEVIALLYRCRWLIELFFRWLKCVLSCRHLVSQAENGIQIQMYCALIACLLIQLSTGRQVRPNQWTYKLLCLYAQGWATEDEVLAHLHARAITENSN